MNTTNPTISLRGGGAALIVELAKPRPRVLHWGADLGELGGADLAALVTSASPSATHNSTDEPRDLTIVPTEADAWSGTPAIEGVIRDGSPYARFVLESHRADEAAGELDIALRDGRTGLVVTVGYRLNRFGVLDVTTAIANESSADALYDLAAVTALLPLPDRATEYLDFTGKWSRERSPQRGTIDQGTRLRESRRGRSSLDSPYLLFAGTSGFDFRSGEVWAVHAGWSGNQRYLVEQLPEGAGAFHSVLGAGELLLPGEVTLRAGDEYRSPVVSFGWSADGLDGIAGALHQTLRARDTHPRSPRPLTLNTWEAVYFDHDLATLERLVDAASRVGVERIVLDDGWFTGRRNDTNGLGDWTVDAEVWPNGLWPLVNAVRERGMQFGLWFEPEMVNPGSRLAQEHPDWILAPSDGVGAAIRHQYVLNLAHPDAWEHILGRIDALVAEYGIDYIKWDHNRELHEAALRNDRDRAGVHEQTLALYRMLDELKLRHPRLEIESCASGGGRVDLGILARTDRVWASDCNDPVERQNIQRWTAQLIPLELIGSHVGAEESHTTHRVTALSFRLATALFGHAGIETDLTRLSREELDTVTAFAALYKELRPLLHSGDLVRGDLADQESVLTGVVSTDRSEAVYSWARLGTSAPVQSGRVRLPGLDPDRGYRIRVRDEIGRTSLHENAPAWLVQAAGDGFAVGGRVLTDVGLPLPTLDAQQAMLFQLTAP